MADKKTWLVIADGVDGLAAADVLAKAGYCLEKLESNAGASLLDQPPLPEPGAPKTVLLRKSAENSLRKIEDTNRALFAAIPDLVFRISRDHKYIGTNKDGGDEFYIQPSEFIGKHVRSVLPEDAAELVIKNMDYVLDTGETCAFDYYLDFHDGPHYFECRMAPCGDEVIAISTEVTDRIRAEQEQRVRADVLRAVNSTPSIAGLAHEVAGLIRKFSGCEAVGIRIQDGDDYPYWEADGFSEEFINSEKYLCSYDENGIVIRDSEGNPEIECMCGNVILGRQDPSLPPFTEFGSFWTNNASESLAAIKPETLRAKTRGTCIAAGYQSLALVPLRAAGNCFGLLQFSDHRTDRFTPNTIKVFESIAENLATSLAHRQAVEALRKSQASLVDAQRLVHLGSYEFDLSDGSGTCTEETFRILGMDPSTTGLSLEECYCAIHPEDRERVEQAFNDIVSHTDIREIDYRLLLPDGTLKYVHSVTHAIQDPYDGKPKLFGTVTDVTERKLTEQELARAREELEKAYKREHHIADVLQHALIPKVDVRKDGYHVLATYLPALDEAEVGGDFYDVFKLRDGRLALVMGDISGKGLTAAVHTAMMKYTLQAYAHEDPRPSSVIERLNRTIYDSALEDLFITVFYGVLDTSAGVLTYANAGHDLPLHFVKAQNQTVPLAPTGKAIGFLRNSKYQERSNELADGDMLIIYTDGITDARSEGNFFGIDGLSKVVISNADAPSHDMVEAVLQAALQASQGKLHDDCAMLVIKRES